MTSPNDNRRIRRLAYGFTAVLSVGVIVTGSVVVRRHLTANHTQAAADTVAFFDPSAAFLSRAESPNSRDTLAAFREHCRRQTPPRLHLITPTGGLNAPDDLMKKGFVLWDYPAVPVQPPVDWRMDPFGDDSWRYHLNTLVFLDPVLKACEESPNPQYLRFAVDVARDWLRQNWDKEGNPNEYAWYDMAVGVRAPKFAWLAHAAACSHEIEDDAVSDLLRGALRHGQELREPANLVKDTNHGIYQMLGLLGLIRTLPNMRGFSEYQQYASSTVEQLFTRHYCEDEGVHLEHSPAYHIYLSNLLAKSLSTGLVNSADRLESLQDRAFDVLAWMIKPDGSYTRFGDGADTRKPVGRSALPVSLRDRYPSCWFALTGGEEGTPSPKEELILPQSGYAFIRGRWPTDPSEWSTGSYLSFQAAFHSRTHKHADDGTFEWSELGRPLLIDAGGFAYQYHLPERKYCESTRAHNTLEIDGKDLSREPSDVYGSAIKRWAKTAGVHAIEAEFVRKPDIQHRRTLVYAPGEWLVVADELRADSEHVYTQWFHFDPALEIEPAGERVRAPIPGTDRHLLVQPLTDSSLRYVRGQREPRLEGWTSLVYRQLTPNWAAAYTSSGTNARLITLLALGSEQATVFDGAVLASDPSRLELKWRLDGQVVRISLVREGAALKLDVFRSEDSPAASRLE